MGISPHLIALNWLNHVWCNSYTLHSGLQGLAPQVEKFIRNFAKFELASALIFTAA
jgi:hypothetical protein